MRRLSLLLSLIALPVSLAAQCTSGMPQTGVYGGALGPAQYVVVMPEPISCYTGQMIFFAHGYIAPGSPADAWLRQLALPDGTSLPGLLNKYGFGFAASSFSKDGLAILPAVQDTHGLKDVVAGLGIPVSRYFVTGASEGGLVATLSVENDPIYKGAISVCGPIGSFQKQLDYFGDVRVLFDYFFPGVLTTGTPGESAINIPDALIANWTTVYEPRVRHAVNTNVLATLQLINTAKIPIGLDFRNAADAITGALWYNVFATRDAQHTLGGNPFDNTLRTYSGSFNDRRLNALVAHFPADADAVASVHAYETSGRLDDPLITLHTTADPIVPFWQETLYKAKAGSTDELIQIPALRYGHCNVNSTEATAALVLMLLKAAP
jgi:hypothetical protein